MTGLEIDSFMIKFKNLWNEGRNATLNLETIAGKVKVNLSVELDNPYDGEKPQHRIQNCSRNSPARQRRRMRRAEAYSAANEKSDDVKVEVTEEETDALEKEVKGNETDAAEALVKATDNTENDIEDLIDEFCSEEEYNNEAEDKFEIFKVTSRQFPDESNKNENEVVKEIERNLLQTFNYFKVKKEDQTLKIIKAEKFDNCVKTLLKVKNIPKVIESVNGLQTWMTDIRKIPEKTSFNPSILSK